MPEASDPLVDGSGAFAEFPRDLSCRDAVEPHLDDHDSRRFASVAEHLSRLHGRSSVCEGRVWSQYLVWESHYWGQLGNASLLFPCAL